MLRLAIIVHQAMHLKITAHEREQFKTPLYKFKRISMSTSPVHRMATAISPRF